MASKTPDRPNLKLVESTETEGRPPPSLGGPGQSLWNRIMAAYEIRDAGGLELLFQACAAADRAEHYHDQIDRDGAFLRTKHGVKEHPGLKHELQARAFVVRTLVRLGLDVEPARPAAGRPGHGIGWRPPE